MKTLKILTWHVHGNYLYYLSHIPHIIYVPYREGRSGSYSGRRGTLPWPDNLIEVPAEEVRELNLDCVIYQRLEHFFRDQYEVMNESQRRLPRIYLEHDPPRFSPTETLHPAARSQDLLLVHVTHFNRLMWNSGDTPVQVIEHGVVVPSDVSYKGTLPRGLTIVNNLKERGRRLGADIFLAAEKEVPLDLIGMDSESMGGLGEIDHLMLPEFQSNYRFLFNPIRYTSLGLAVCEAMMLGLPVVGLATTAMVKAVKNSVTGFVDTDPEILIKRMRMLLDQPEMARRMGERGKRLAEKRFNINRFIDDWNTALFRVTKEQEKTYVYQEEAAHG